MEENKISKKPLINEIECAGCSICIETCPLNCLALSKPKFQGDTHTFAELIESDKCKGCGLCAKACPIDAIQI